MSTSRQKRVRGVAAASGLLVGIGTAGLLADRHGQPLVHAAIALAITLVATLAFVRLSARSQR